MEGAKPMTIVTQPPTPEEIAHTWADKFRVDRLAGRSDDEVPIESYILDAVREAVAAEREACAQFIEKRWVDLPNSLRYDGPSYLELPDAIRARGGAGGAE
jgi:hypothetical protein